MSRTSEKTVLEFAKPSARELAPAGSETLRHLKWFLNDDVQTDESGSSPECLSRDWHILLFVSGYDEAAELKLDLMRNSEFTWNDSEAVNTFYENGEEAPLSDETVWELLDEAIERIWEEKSK